MKSQSLRMLIGLGLVLGVAGPFPALAADPQPCAVSGASVTGVHKLGDPTRQDNTVELGNKIAIVLDKPAEFLAEAMCRKKSIILYVNGQATGNKIAGLTGPQNTTPIFFLRQVGATHDFWNVLLGRPDFDSRTLRISVGIEDQTAQTPLPIIGDKKLELTVLPVFALLFWLVIFAGLIVGFFMVARNSSILRDQMLDPANPNELGAYSLSKIQGAWWFFVILASYLLIGIVTGDSSNSINSTALILLGIGAGTVLGSAAIDASKIDKRKADLATAKNDRKALAVGDAKIAATDAKIEALNGKSVGFLADILSDGNGMNFHRFQLAVWTLVLSIIFMAQVYTELAMPTFNQTLMGLLGLSAGTYLGLKIPEPTKPTA